MRSDTPCPRRLRPLARPGRSAANPGFDGVGPDVAAAVGDDALLVPTSDNSRVGYAQVQHAFGTGAPGTIQIATTERDAPRIAAVARADAGIARVMPAMPGAEGSAMVQAVSAIACRSHERTPIQA